MGIFSFFKKQAEQVEQPAKQHHHGIDCELKYCPRCESEYRAEIECCATCEVDLISGAEKLARLQQKNGKFLSRSMDISAEDKLVTLRKGQIIEVKLVQKLLAEQRIPSLIGGEADCCRKGCRGGPEMHLQVREADAQDAMMVLAEHFKASTALDSHDLSHLQTAFDPRAAATACPACGTRFAPTTTTCPECGLCFG